MAQSHRLRLQDVRRAFRLVDECRELGSSSALWGRQAVEGLCRLVGARSGVNMELTWLRPQLPGKLIQVSGAGFDPKERALIAEWFRQAWPDKSGPFLTAMLKLTERLVTHSRTQLVSDRSWYMSPVYETRKAVGCDHNVYSVYQTSADGTTNFIALDRAAGERDFSPRERGLLHLFHDELGRLIGPVLARASAPDPTLLSPRLQQTLACLLEGDSEKQVAARLGLSGTTVHEYVTALYRHFEVNSRGELLAWFLKPVAARWRTALGNAQAVSDLH